MRLTIGRGSNLSNRSIWLEADATPDKFYQGVCSPEHYLPLYEVSHQIALYAERGETSRALHRPLRALFLFEMASHKP